MSWVSEVFHLGFFFTVPSSTSVPRSRKFTFRSFLTIYSYLNIVKLAKAVFISHEHQQDTLGRSQDKLRPFLHPSVDHGGLYGKLVIVSAEHNTPIPFRRTEESGIQERKCYQHIYAKVQRSECTYGPGSVLLSPTKKSLISRTVGPDCGYLGFK